MRVFTLMTILCCLSGLRLAAEESDPNVPPELLARTTEAKGLISRGDFAGAEKIYREMLKVAPKNAYLLSNLGVALFREGKYKLSEETFRKAVEVDENDGFTHCALGILYYSQAKYDVAMDELRRALEINPKDATAHNYLGLALGLKGAAEEAENELEISVMLDPKYADAAFNLAVALATAQPPKKAAARKYYKQAIDLGAERDVALEQLMKEREPEGVVSPALPKSGIPGIDPTPLKKSPAKP